MARARRYSRSVRITGPSAGAPFAVLAPTTKAVVVREVGLVIVAATATSFGIIRSATVGTASSTLEGQPHNPSEAASTAGLATAWSAAPTIAGSPAWIRRVELPATAGGSVIWRFDEDEPLIAIPGATGALVFWNFGAGAASNADLHVTWDEGV
jgi:hypothetical protein